MRHRGEIAEYIQNGAEARDYSRQSNDRATYRLDARRECRYRWRDARGTFRLGQRVYDAEVSPPLHGGGLPIRLSTGVGRARHKAFPRVYDATILTDIRRIPAVFRPGSRL